MLIDSNINISNFFKEKQSKIENVKLIHEINGIPFTKTKEELVDKMIHDRLILAYAKKQNIQVTDEEVMDYAKQMKELYQDPTPEFAELLAGLADSLGVSKEEYFTHPKTLENYRNWLLSQKVVEQLEGSTLLLGLFFV